MGKGHRFTREYLEVIPEFDPSAPNHPQICRVSEIRGKSLIQLQLASGEYTLAVLPPRFRGVLWLRRGALVIAVDIPTVEEDKVTLSIENLLTQDDIREYEKQGHIPECFKRPKVEEESGEEDSISEDSRSGKSESETE